MQLWIRECADVSSDLTNRKFDHLLELSNRRYRSEYYASWLNRLATQTPDDHPDKESLLAAVAYHRDSVFRAESIKKRNDIVQRALANEDSGGSLLSKVFKSQDSTDNNSLDDAEFTELCEIFHDGDLRLKRTVRDLELYCRQVNTYCAEFADFFKSFELFMRVQAGPYSDLVSKWVRFAVSFHQAFKEDLNPGTYVSRFKNQELSHYSQRSDSHSTNR